MADAEVQTGAERVVRSNVGRCPRVRVLIPPPASFRTRYYPSWDPRVHPRSCLRSWLMRAARVMSEAWNNVEFIKGRPWAIISPRIFVSSLSVSFFLPAFLDYHALRLRHLNGFSPAHLISRERAKLSWSTFLFAISFISCFALGRKLHHCAIQLSEATRTREELTSHLVRCTILFTFL